MTKILRLQVSMEHTFEFILPLTVLRLLFIFMGNKSLGCGGFLFIYVTKYILYLMKHNVFDENTETDVTSKYCKYLKF